VSSPACARCAGSIRSRRRFLEHRYYGLPFKILDEWDLRKPWPAIHGFAVNMSNNPPRIFTSPSRNRMSCSILRWSNNWLLNAANGLETVHLRNFDRYFQADFVVWMDARRNIHVYADV